MKKFVFVFIFLLILGGAGFLTGWLEFSVPPGSYGVMRSKTHGVYDAVIREGELNWVWYKLIPTNAEIKVFELKPVHHSLNNSGTLALGMVYAAIAGIQADFSWRISGDFSFSVKPDALPALVQKEGIGTQDDLIALEREYCRRIEDLVLRRMNLIVDDQSKMETLLLTGFLPEFVRDIETAFPELENINCHFGSVQYPDLGLYRALRELYEEYLAYQKRYLEGDIERNAEYWVSARLKLDELEKYGEILSRYPILLQFLAMERDYASSLFGIQ